MASLEGRVLSLTHELEAAREEAAAAEEARAASVKEYERALAGRVSRCACMYVWADCVGYVVRAMLSSGRCLFVLLAYTQC